MYDSRLSKTQRFDSLPGPLFLGFKLSTVSILKVFVGDIPSAGRRSQDSSSFTVPNGYIIRRSTMIR